MPTDDLYGFQSSDRKEVHHMLNCGSHSVLLSEGPEPALLSSFVSGLDQLSLLVPLTTTPTLILY